MRRSSAGPGHPGTHRQVLWAADGVQIEAVYEPCTEGLVPGEGSVIVVAHGFTGALDRPAIRRAAAVFGRSAAVVTFSFRGHGRSGGRSTVGDREVLDLAAVVGWARSLGHDRVVTVGFSMGGSVVLRHAALYRDRPATRPDAVISVSAPARWYYRGTAPMRRLHWVVTRPVGRLVGRCGFGTRIDHREWDPVPLSPVESVPLIAPTPLLVVHGDRDTYFPLDHPRLLAAAGAAELWIEPGMGHAENATDEALLNRLADWAAGAGGPGSDRTEHDAARSEPAASFMMGTDEGSIDGSGHDPLLGGGQGRLGNR